MSYIIRKYSILVINKENVLLADDNSGKLMAKISRKMDYMTQNATLEESFVESELTRKVYRNI